MSSLSAQSLHKNERLHSKNDIDRLLSKGRFFVVDNVFRCCVLPRSADGSGVAVGNGSASARMMVSVPKKCFKRAVKRNLLKRRIREAYRRNKPSLPMDILFVYLPKEILSYEQIEQTLIRALERAEEKLRTCASAAVVVDAPAVSAAPAAGTAASAPAAAPASAAAVVDAPVASATVVGASSPAASPNSGSQTGASQREVSQPGVAQNKFVAVLKWIGNAPFLLLISFYRACVSPFTPPACRFTPTCSQYAMEAFKKYGPFKGLYLTVKRILRCRPGGGSGYDPVP